MCKDSVTSPSPITVPQCKITPVLSTVLRGAWLLGVISACRPLSGRAPASGSECGDRDLIWSTRRTAGQLLSETRARASAHRGSVYKAAEQRYLCELLRPVSTVQTCVCVCEVEWMFSVFDPVQCSPVCSGPVSRPFEILKS